MKTIATVIFGLAICLCANAQSGVTQSTPPKGVLSAEDLEEYLDPIELSAQQIARRALPAVPLIICDDGKNVSQGSGFFVRPGVLLTNYYVIKGMARGFVRIAVGSNKERHWRNRSNNFLTQKSLSVSTSDWHQTYTGV